MDYLPDLTYRSASISLAVLDYFIGTYSRLHKLGGPGIVADKTPRGGEHADEAEVVAARRGLLEHRRAEAAGKVVIFDGDHLLAPRQQMDDLLVNRGGESRIDHIDRDFLGTEGLCGRQAFRQDSPITDDRQGGFVSPSDQDALAQLEGRSDPHSR